jgi:hypothetical protein
LNINHNVHQSWWHCRRGLYEAGVTPSEIYDINQLEAMQDAWNNVDTTAIQNCWQKANNSDVDPAAHVKTFVKTALDDLEATGALQRSNRMDIAELLNPVVESHNLSTDEYIFNCVMDAKKFERNAGGDVDDHIDIPAPAGPTRRESLKAALMLRKQVATPNDPFARKLEVMLGSFGQRTRRVEMQGMTDTKLTDYLFVNSVMVTFRVTILDLEVNEQGLGA